MPTLKINSSSKSSPKGGFNSDSDFDEKELLSPTKRLTESLNMDPAK